MLGGNLHGFELQSDQEKSYMQQDSYRDLGNIYARRRVTVQEDGYWECSGQDNNYRPRVQLLRIH